MSQKWAKSWTIAFEHAYRATSCNNQRTSAQSASRKCLFSFDYSELFVQMLTANLQFASSPCSSPPYLFIQMIFRYLSFGVYIYNINSYYFIYQPQNTLQSQMLGAHTSVQWCVRARHFTTPAAPDTAPELTLSRRH